MKKKTVLTVMAALMVATFALTACNVSVSTESYSSESTVDDQSSVVEYEFETFDEETVVIDEANIESQEKVDEPLEYTLPDNAEQIAPGRDFVLFTDGSNYYVEDAANGLVTIARM